MSGAITSLCDKSQIGNAYRDSVSDCRTVSYDVNILFKIYYAFRAIPKCSTWNTCHQCRNTKVTYPIDGPEVTLYLGDYAQAASLVSVLPEPTTTRACSYPVPTDHRLRVSTFKSL
jgi:hypothetical protein